MKRQLTLLVLLLVLSVQAMAKISLGLNGGMIYNSAPFATKEKWYGDSKGKSFAVLGAKLTVGIPLFQFGVGVRYGKTGFSYDVPVTNSGVTLSSSTSEGRFIMPYVFANYRIGLPKSYLYFGVNAGYIKYDDRTNVHTMVLAQPPIVNTIYEMGETMDGMLSGGVQAGYTFNITDQFGVQVETGVNYTQIKTQLPLNVQPITFGFTESAYLQIPVTAGIVYSF